MLVPYMKVKLGIILQGLLWGNQLPIHTNEPANIFHVIFFLIVGPGQKSDICSDKGYSLNCGLEPGQAGGQVVSNNQYRIATAIYPSASMMNHSW